MIASLATYPHEVLRTRLQMVRNHKPGSGSGPGSGTGVAVSGSSSGSGIAANGGSGTVRVGGAGPSAHPMEPQSSRAGVFIPPRPAHAANPDLYSPHPGEPPERRPQPNGGPNGNGGGQQSRWRRKGGIIDTAIKIKRQDGWRGFYRGLSINLVRTVPNSAVTMLT